MDHARCCRAARRDRAAWHVVSADRALSVLATGKLSEWWPRIAPRLPGVADTPPIPDCPKNIELAVPASLGEDDARRLLNAGLHRRHADRGTLCIHAVAAVKAGAAVLLLGGHGAGKSLVGIALERDGWQLAAGDVALLDVQSPEGMWLKGGTRAYQVRPTAVQRWFPERAAADDGTLAPQWIDQAAMPVPVHAALLVDVDGDPRAGNGAMQHLDRHTAATVWFRASGHLLGRMLERSHLALHTALETPGQSRDRVRRAQELAGRLPIVAAWGTPEAIATQAQRLAVGEG